MMTDAEIKLHTTRTDKLLAACLKEAGLPPAARDGDSDWIIGNSEVLLSFEEGVWTVSRLKWDCGGWDEPPSSEPVEPETFTNPGAAAAAAVLRLIRERLALVQEFAAEVCGEVDERELYCA